MDSTDDSGVMAATRVITIQLTEQEAQTVFEIADAACRGGGLQMAGKCALLAQKLSVAISAAQKPATP